MHKAAAGADPADQVWAIEAEKSLGTYDSAKADNSSLHHWLRLKEAWRPAPTQDIGNIRLACCKLLSIAKHRLEHRSRKPSFLRIPTCRIILHERLWQNSLPANNSARSVRRQLGRATLDL